MEPCTLKKLGANHLGDGSYGFLLWSPYHEQIKLKIVSPTVALYPMRPCTDGYFEVVAEGLEEGTRYVYVLPDGREFPDPASRWQPDGVHGSSALVDHRAFAWKDNGWQGVPLEDYILYELHVGTFTLEGTFDAATEKISYLKDLGITAVELMPVAQFPGSRNWGYDGTYPYAVQQSYGGTGGLKCFVDSCHAQGMTVVLDVVYNHLGPEGNYSGMYGPYLTGRYQTPWGMAVNFDGPHSDDVRRFFIENALYWFEEFHIDALRIDAVHGIIDMSATQFLRELAQEVGNRIMRRVYLIPESDLNDVRLVDSPERGGHGLDAQWLDDYHHALHTLLTGELTGYYADFGSVEHMAKALREGFVYSGQRSDFRQRRHGNSSAHIDPWRFVVFAQNHDQVGNRMSGDRLATTLGPAQLQLTAAMTVLTPYLPMIFMGEEYAEDAPFLYFVSHSDEGLTEAVRKGRKEEFSAFVWKGEPPDPQDEGTFESSKLDHGLRQLGQHKEMYEFYKKLIALRKSLPALHGTPRTGVSVSAEGRTVLTKIEHAGETILCLANFSDNQAEANLPRGESWQVLLDTSHSQVPVSSDTIKARITLGGFAFALLRKEE